MTGSDGGSSVSEVDADGIDLLTWDSGSGFGVWAGVGTSFHDEEGSISRDGIYFFQAAVTVGRGSFYMSHSSTASSRPTDQIRVQPATRSRSFTGQHQR